MASNFDLVGFDLKTEQDIETFFRQSSFRRCEERQFGLNFVSISDDHRAELVYCLKSGDILGVSPFVRGASPASVTIDGIHPNADYPWADTLFDCSISSFNSPLDVVTRCTVLSVNFPEVVLSEKKGWFGRPRSEQNSILNFIEQPVKIAFTCLSHETTLYDSDDAFNEANKDFPIAPLSFMPSGMFGNTPENVALGAGSILDSGTVRNTFGGPAYCWALVDSLWGNLAVSWAENTTPPPSIGQVIQYNGAILARLVP